MRKIRGAICIATTLVLCGAAFSAAQTAKDNKPTAVTKEAYCTSTGGPMEVRHAVYGTNNAFQNWLPLAGVQGFCQYTLADDGSRIHISLQSLFTTKPTLACRRC